LKIREKCRKPNDFGDLKDRWLFIYPLNIGWERFLKNKLEVYAVIAKDKIS